MSHTSRGRLHGSVVKLFAIVMAVACSASPLSAQASTEVGIVGGAQFNVHTAQFSQLGDFASCCPLFDGGSGTEYYFGAFLTLPINETFRVHTRLTYSSEAGTLTNDEGSFVADLRDTAVIVPAVFRHELNASLSTVQLEPFLAFRPLGNLDLLVGGSIGMVVSSSFVQTETLIEPADFGNYVGANRTWVTHDAEIPGASSIRATAAIGARYVVSLNTKGTLFAAPEVFYHIPVTDVTSETSWTVSGLRAGIEIGFILPSSPPEEETVQSPLDSASKPNVLVAPLPPTVTLALSSPTDPSWTINDGILVEETQVVDFIPLLNHVYFEEGLSAIPSRYITTPSDTLDPNDLAGSINYVIQSLAQRLIESEESVTIVGHTSNTPNDRGQDLARARALAVSEALQKMGVDGSTIKIKTRTLPVMPTRASAEDDQAAAHAENRRVEIIPNDPTLLDPLALASRFVTTTPERIDVSTTGSSTLGVARFETETPLGSGTDSFSMQVNQLDTGRRFVRVAGSAVDSLGVKATDSLFIPLNRMSVERKRSNRQADFEIERYSLILFGFNDASVTADHRRQLERIKERMNQGASVRIIGMTDSMGASDYNKNLSRKRAIRVAEALGLSESSVEAVGDTQARFNNALPEGRAYNRTVIIEVRMPVR